MVGSIQGIDGDAMSPWRAYRVRNQTDVTPLNGPEGLEPALHGLCESRRKLSTEANLAR
jgi:hypothetical protein